MAIKNRKIICLTVTLFTLSLLAGCGEPVKMPQEPTAPAPTIDSNTTIGSLAEIFAPGCRRTEKHDSVVLLGKTLPAEADGKIRVLVQDG